MELINLPTKKANTRVYTASDDKLDRNIKADIEDSETYAIIDSETFQSVGKNDEVNQTDEKPSTINRTNIGPSQCYETLTEVGTVKMSSDNSKSSGSTYTKQMCVFFTIIGTVCISISTVSLVLVLRNGGKEDAATNGAWNTWESWGSCSVSCDVGMQARTRNCSGPTSAEKGHQCFGTDIEYRLCTTVSCYDGGWSAWGSWDTCSASCDGGIQTRLRTCTNPSASLLGRNCYGNNVQVETCNRQACRESPVAFNVYNSTFINNSLVFTDVLLNAGEAYDNTSGFFTTPVTGIYQFNVHLCFSPNKDADYTLDVEDTPIISGEYRSSSDSDDGKCTSFSAVAFVHRGERVYVYCQHFYETANDVNSFSGTLVFRV